MAWNTTEKRHVARFVLIFFLVGVLTQLILSSMTRETFKLDLSPHDDPELYDDSLHTLEAKLNQFEHFYRRCRQEAYQLYKRQSIPGCIEKERFDVRINHLKSDLTKEIYELIASVEYFMNLNSDQLTPVQKRTLNQFRLAIAGAMPEQISAKYWRNNDDYGLNSNDLEGA